MNPFRRRPGGPLAEHPSGNDGPALATQRRITSWTYRLLPMAPAFLTSMD